MVCSYFESIVEDPSVSVQRPVSIPVRGAHGRQPIVVSLSSSPPPSLFHSLSPFLSLKSISMSLNEDQKIIIIMK